MELYFYQQIFEKYSNIKFSENSFSWAEFFHAGGLTDEQTDMTRRVVVFHNFVNAPKNYLCSRTDV